MEIAARNPVGPSPVFARTYNSWNAANGYSSPGLPLGWTHNYDVKVTAKAGKKGPLLLTYPNGATEQWALGAHSSGSSPVNLTPPAGTPYLVSGAPDPSPTSPTGWLSLTMTFQDESKWTFSPLAGTTFLLTRITNIAGRSILLSFGSNNTLSSISDDTGIPTRYLLYFTYGPVGYTTLLTGAYEYSDSANPRHIFYGYNLGIGQYTVSQLAPLNVSNPPIQWQYALGGVYGVAVPDPSGATNGLINNAISYDTNGRVQKIIDANGNQHAYTYGAATQVQTSSQGVVAATGQQNFDSLNRDTGQIDAIGNQTSVFYEDPNNPFKPTRAINRSNQTVDCEYDPTFGNLLFSHMPSNGGRLSTTYSYDYTSFAAGRLTSIQVSGKTPASVTYYTNNTSVTVGGVSILQPNGLVHQMTTAGPGGGAPVTTTYVYTALGNVLTLTVPGSNHAVTYTYNYTSDPTFNYTQSEALGEPITITNPLSQTTHYRYDARGNLISVLDALMRETDYIYNSADQLVNMQNPASNQTGTGRSYSAYAYLYLGGPLQVTSFYDESGTLVRSVQLTEGKEGEAKAQSGSTEKATLAYDPVYRLKTLTDGNSHASSHTYDLKGNLTKFSHPLANTGYSGFDTAVGVYDKDDNLTQFTDGNLKTTNYTLAPDDSRLTDVVYPANTLSATHYDYDIYGRVTHRSDNAGNFYVTFDELNNVMSATTTYTGQPALTVSYTYNPDGSRSTMTTPAGVYSYIYDDAGNLLSVTFPWGQTITYQYDHANRITQQYQTSFTTTYSYDTLNNLLQLNQITNDSSHVTLANFYGMRYDALGNRLGMSFDTAKVDNTYSPGGVVIWTYDTAGKQDRLTSEYLSQTAGSSSNVTYYDTFQPDAADNLVSGNADNQPPLGPATDGNGNLSGYYYDVNNHVIGTATVYAGYRDDGLRAVKTSLNGYGSTLSRYFIYDGTHVVYEIGVGSDTTAYGYGANGLVQSYVKSIGSPSGNYTAYAFNPMGSVVSRVPGNNRASTPVQDITTYSAFGSKRLYYNPNYAGQKTPPDAVGYGGQWGNYTDVESGLVLMTYRTYSPRDGCFLTRDPSGYGGGMNLYAYCRNNPINYADPLGLQGTVHLSGEQAGYVWQEANNTFINNPGLSQSLGASTVFAGSAASSYLGGASVLGPVGVAAVAIPLASYGAYTYIGVPLANHLYGPQTLGSTVDSAYARLYQNLRNCFVAGTLIAMADGTFKPIETLHEGDLVMSCDPLTGQILAKAVLQTFTREVEQTLVLRFDNGEPIETTPGHPFYVEGKGFVLAGQLALGNAIVTRAGPTAIVTGIQNKTTRVRVYNFEVADFHTYFVGSHNGGLWVHNTSYRDTYFNAHPYLNRADWVVHHVIPQHVWTRYRGLFTASEKDALSNLAGVPAFHNGDMHLSSMASAWNNFYRNHPVSTTTTQQIEAFARSVDEKWGGNFYPYR